MALLAFVAVKFAFYCAICSVFWRICHVDGGKDVSFALKFGAIRLAVGFASGFFIFYWWMMLQGGSLKDQDAVVYVLSFGIARYFEWLLVLHLMERRFKPVSALFGKRGQVWVAIGTLFNLVADQIALVLHVDSQLKFVC
jgi:hypothetical protein